MITHAAQKSEASNCKPWLTPLAAYVHIPFCAAKCGYCDFNSFAGLMGLSRPYVDALCRQIETTLRRNPETGVLPLQTVFYGGGTPSILPAEDLIRALETLKSEAGIEDTAEVTFEANPESATLPKLAELRRAGFNRISLGAQSFDDEMLNKLGRVHNHRKFLQAFENAREAGFDNISFDLMFALPGQSLDSLRQTLDEAVGLGAEHISCYCLTIEEDTEFFTMFQKNILDIPSESEQIDMYYAVKQSLEDAGYLQYEISNYAKNGLRCRHNEVYWRNEAYWGFGTGAVAYVNNQRIKWETDPAAYIEQVKDKGEPEPVEIEELTTIEQLGETAMLSLRTSQGIDIAALDSRFGLDSQAEFSEEIEQFGKQGLLEHTDGRIRLTDRGLVLANEVMAAFLR